MEMSSSFTDALSDTTVYASETVEQRLCSSKEHISNQCVSMPESDLKECSWLQAIHGFIDIGEKSARQMPHIPSYLLHILLHIHIG